ncbi:hypothetical protein RR48_07231 [Papilio machaon]|uniref:Uncharacterized protein n=1 Tax=Papilio machaon TaxID=76193 RepID=A0A194RLT2_PAPMA|nr:hypothetical protein RR48_07231 [Papilio machaon]
MTSVRGEGCGVRPQPRVVGKGPMLGVQAVPSGTCPKHPLPGSVTTFMLGRDGRSLSIYLQKWQGSSDCKVTGKRFSPRNHLT